MSKSSSRGNPQPEPLNIAGAPAYRPKPAGASLNVAGSAAHMHSRDYIEIINVIYKDDHKGCCGKSHTTPKAREKPIMRKTWKKLDNEDFEERRMFRESVRVPSKPNKHYHLGSPSPSSPPHQEPPDPFTQSKSSFLPDIYNSITISTPPSRRARSSGHRVNSASQRAKSAHINTCTRGSSSTKDSNIAPSCGCHEGLIYLRKTHEWQNLLNEYRHEILKLRDALKEKEKALQNKKTFKRSAIQERRDNLNDLLKEHRFNSYHVLRMRMEERMKHEHRVFERLSKRTSNLHIDSTSDFNTSPMSEDTTSLSSQPVSSCSNGPDSPPLSTDEFSDHWKLLQQHTQDERQMVKRKLNKQVKFPRTTTTDESNYHTTPTDNENNYQSKTTTNGNDHNTNTTTIGNNNTKYTGSLSRKKIDSSSVKVQSRSEHVQRSRSTHSNHQVASHLDQNVAAAPTRKPPRVVTRKRVVRCPCLKHKDG